MNTKRKRLILILIIAAVAVVSAVLFFILRDGRDRYIPSHLIATVAWNPHSTADDMAHAFAASFTRTQLTIQNIPGANGARGLNAVYEAARDGGNILSTSLSAFVTAEAMGFGESPRQNWTGWLCAFAPAIVVVSADSSFATLNDLTAAIHQSPRALHCANSGFGTISFTAAELFRTKTALEFEHISHAGSSPAVNALLNGVADFAILTSTEITHALRSGEIRALAAFTESDFAIWDGDREISIPSVVGFNGNLDNLLPFGEFYGIFIPANTPQNSLNAIESQVQTAAESETFVAFIRERGLAPFTPNRARNAVIIENFCNHVCQTLTSAGFLPVLP
ncbi:MAG: tripartite tricarboxylate transporter substrate-binding protein [Defluviitaleaceae bacterium]|nr:tripartite tricarboxylate transporter substrate-binding protein [Defluviitaleaceae bacterium]MCL2240757.1 tripartite tricarboxylate transporter substrate-binding protein [Defluviitaleaceae bacterium]